MAAWPSYGTRVKGEHYEAGEFLDVHEYRHVLRCADEIALHRAMQSGRKVNLAWSDPSSRLLERHDASDLETQNEGEVLASNWREHPQAKIYAFAVRIDKIRQLHP